MKTSRLREFLRKLPVIQQYLQAKIVAEALRADVAQLRHALVADRAERRGRQMEETRGVRTLHRFEHSVYSQNGEDGVLQEIFRRIGAPTRMFVELGVGDGWENNTLFLHTLGWRGWWIDGDGAFLETIATWPREAAAELRHRVAKLTRENAAALLADCEVPREFDLLSLDVDQNTYHLWSALESYRPRVVVIEYNRAIPPSVDWKVDYVAERSWDGTRNFGASLKALELLGRRLGYRLVHVEMTGVNAFFVRDDLAGDEFEVEATAEHHFVSNPLGLGPELPGRRARLDRLR